MKTLLPFKVLDVLSHQLSEGARLHRKTLFPLRQEACFQEEVRSGDTVDSRQTHFFHQAVLQGPEQSVDAPFRLRTVGRNPFDPQFTQGASELQERFFSAQLLLQCSDAVAMAKDAVLIGVMGQRTSIALQPAPQGSHVFFRGVVLHQAGPQPAGGIIEHTAIN
jgi:hypothetical protein